MNDKVKEAIINLNYLVECRCDEAYTDRGRHDPHSACDYAEELKPCPFCGGEASEVEDQGHSTAYNVGCFNGDCTIEPNTWADTKAEAIAAWNTRADLSRDLEQARQDIADLRQAVRYANDHADQAKSERDAAIARAEKAEADRDEWRKTAITKIEGKTE